MKPDMKMVNCDLLRTDCSLMTFYFFFFNIVVVLLTYKKFLGVLQALFFFFTFTTKLFISTMHKCYFWLTFRTYQIAVAKCSVKDWRHLRLYRQRQKSLNTLSTLIKGFCKTESSQLCKNYYVEVQRCEATFVSNCICPCEFGSYYVKSFCIYGDLRM